MLAVCWRRRAYHLVKKCCRKGPPRPSDVPLCRAGHANYGSGHRSARNGHSALGKLLSRPLLFNLGIRFLLLGEQLHHGRIRRSDPPAQVATAGPFGEYGGHADVRNLGGPSIRGDHPSGRRRVTISSITSSRTRYCGSHRPSTKVTLLLRSVAVGRHALKNNEL